MLNYEVAVASCIILQMRQVEAEREAKFLRLLTRQ